MTKNIFLLLAAVSLFSFSHAHAEEISELSEAEKQEILARGEIPKGQYIAGGIVGSVAGFGIGHAIQGRWTDTGWIATVGEAASMTMLVVGIAESGCTTSSVYGFSSVSCTGGGELIAMGAIGLTAFRVFEVIDVWVGAARQNRRYRKLKGTEKASFEPGSGLTLLSSRSGALGLGYAFRF